MALQVRELTLDLSPLVDVWHFYELFQLANIDIPAELHTLVKLFNCHTAVIYSQMYFKNNMHLFYSMTMLAITYLIWVYQMLP